MDFITLTITKWNKHNPRKDVKRPSWFPLDNRLVEDDDFITFTGMEFKAWIYILSKASEKQSDTIRITFEAASRKANIPPKEMRSAIKKLETLGIVTVGVTITSRESDVGGTLHNKTLQDTTLQDKTDNTPAPLVSDLADLYAIYPRKEGKSKGLAKLATIVKDQDTFERVKTAILRYIEHLKKRKIEPDYIKHFSTWVNHWTDWDAADAGQTTVGLKNYTNERETDHDAEIEEAWGA